MRHFAVTIVSSLLLFLSGLSANAQQSGPIRLAPLPPPENGTGNAGAQPATTPGEPTSGLNPGGVLIRGLDAVAEDAVGVLGASDGGLGDDMWAGTDHATAIRLLSTLPSSAPTGEARELTRRLLLSIATPPPGGGPVAKGNESSLLAARVAGLVAIGAPDDAIDLAQAADSRRVPDHLARSIVSAYFLRGDLETGCGVLDGYEAGYAEPFWQKALIICQIAAGKGAEASLGLDLLREERGDGSGFFQNLAYATSVGASVSPEQLETPGAADILTFALLTLSRAEMPDWMLESDDPGLVRAMLRSVQLDPTRKLALAHRALRRGQVGAGEVVAVYEGLEASDEAIAAALLDPDTVDRDVWLAYLYLAARNQTVSIARSEALWEAWTLAQAADVDDIVMTTTASLLADIPATTDFGWLAAAAARAALLAGEDDLAIDWYQLVVRQARSVADMARATALMWPEMRVIGRNLPDAPVAETLDAPGPNTAPETTAVSGIAAVAGARIPATGTLEQQVIQGLRTPAAPVPWNPARLTRWIDLAGSNDGAADIGRALYLLQILGDPVTEEHWRRAPVVPDDTRNAGGEMPSVAVLAGLARASAAGRRAEATLYAMIVLGQAGATPHAGVVGTVVRGLQRVGMETDAQAIARAALVAPAQ